MPRVRWAASKYNDMTLVSGQRDEDRATDNTDEVPRPSALVQLHVTRLRIVQSFTDVTFEVPLLVRSRHKPKPHILPLTSRLP